MLLGLLVELATAVGAERYTVSIVAATVGTEHNYNLLKHFLIYYHINLYKSIVFCKKQAAFNKSDAKAVKKASYCVINVVV